MTDALSLFHPTVARWFAARIGSATAAQEEAWPRIAGGEHVLLIAPTGSGKTMAAFLWALDRLLTGRWPSDRTSVLYVSPLRALNNDIQRNLLFPLHELRLAFMENGHAVPRVRVLTRSGDTPPAARRSMLRHPPEILITTPESLNLMLSSPRGRVSLQHLKAVIIDEVHAVAGTKRGSHLMTAVERLVPLAGEFQRIALSATITPEQTAARFVGGYLLTGSREGAEYLPRSVAVIRTMLPRRCEIRVGRVADAREEEGAFWEGVAGELKAGLMHHRSTVVFTNSRRLSERLTLAINRAADATVAYAHHGSLSKEIRHDVERRLKAGELKAIVATSSLELGIDVGAIDEVVLVSNPPTVSSAVQRIGRSGHRVGGMSRGWFLPIQAHDLVEAAAMVPSVLSGDIEPTHPVSCPLDVLAQVIVSMVGVEAWNVDQLFNEIRCSEPFHHLSRTAFDSVIGMLAGRYAGTRVHELAPLVSVDPTDHTIMARRGALLVLYGSGGVIPDRGYFHLRRHDTGARVGELDEEFVWEASIGQAFTLGTQTWRIERITHDDVFVSLAARHAPSTPFWRGEGHRRTAHLGELIGQFLEVASSRLDDDAFLRTLHRHHHMEPSAAESLVSYLRRQVAVTGCALPHRHHIVVEHVETGPGGGVGHQTIIHSCFGLAVNHPWALALGAAWEARNGTAPEIYPSNDTICVVLPDGTGAAQIMSLVSADSLDLQLRACLEDSGLFAARFRECAGRALLLPRRRARERMPLWMSRLRSQRLLEAVKGFEDFPIVLETWRTCLKDEFDLDRLRAVLGEIRDGAIRVSETRTLHQSPFAQAAAWRQLNEYMYRGDVASGRSALRTDLILDIARSPHLRPRIPEEEVRRFVRKRQRLLPGYLPVGARELLDWVRERLAIPVDEWVELSSQVEAGSGGGILASIQDRLAWVCLPDGVRAVTAREDAARVMGALGPCASVRSLSGDALRVDPLPDDPDDLLVGLLGEWLRFHGPLPRAAVARRIGVSPARATRALQVLEDDGAIVSGCLMAGSDDECVCDATNLTWLLRLMRRTASASFHPLPADHLPAFLASFQGLVRRGASQAALRDRLAQLLMYPASAGLWETEILPARLAGYSPGWLDRLMVEGEIRWVGWGDRCVLFTRRDDLDLVGDETDDPPFGPACARACDAFDDLFPDPRAKYDLSTLMHRSQGSVGDLVARLWKAVWAGQVANDSFAVLRRGNESGFQVPMPVAPTVMRRAARTSFGRWRSLLPQEGNWYRIPWPDPDAGALEREERQRARARILLDRYGILCRELLAHEPPWFRWGAMFRTLRVMELAGEVVSGCFFEGIAGVQFMSPRAFEALRRGVEDEVFWVNAADPASPCGCAIEGLRTLPRRVSGTHLVFHGTRLVVVAERNGATLRIVVAPDDPHLPRYLDVLRHLVTRSVDPQRRIVIETINGTKAAASPYVATLRTVGDVSVDPTTITLYRRF